MVSYSDEKTFTSVLRERPRIKRTRGSRYEDGNQLNHAGITNVAVNVWGYMIYGIGVRVFRVSRAFNQDEYADCLRTNYFDGSFDTANIIFMQDNASFHNTLPVFRLLKEKNMRVYKHPPQSSDLNPIENIWQIAQRKLNVYLRTNFINNEADLFSLVEDYCESISVDLVNKLIDSMPSRRDDCDLNNGGNTRY